MTVLTATPIARLRVKDAAGAAEGGQRSLTRNRAAAQLQSRLEGKPALQAPLSKSVHTNTRATHPPKRSPATGRISAARQRALWITP